MKSRDVVRLTASLAAVFLCTACLRTVESTTRSVQPYDPQEGVGSATDLPARFTVVRAARTADECPPELADPPATTLTLRRSIGVPAADTAGMRMFGDYQVSPPGRYGDQPGQGLRIDCTRLRGVGIVPLDP
jgi:hypothetical protein